MRLLPPRLLRDALPLWRRAAVAWRLAPRRVRALAAAAAALALFLLLRAPAHAPDAACQAEPLPAAAWPPATLAPFPFAAAAAEAEADTSFTVVLNTFKRRDLLRRAVAHYAACARVDAIRVVWSEQVPPPRRDAPADAAYFEAASHPRPGLVRYDVHPTTSINNRFVPIAGLRTSALLSVDDDMVPPCGALDDAFAAWRAAPHALVGFYPRLHVPAPSRPGCAGTAYRYVSAEPALAWHGEFSIILTKACFLHRRYLSLYSEAMPAAIRDYITVRRECEDIAMAFLVANATAQPAVWVRPPFAFWAGAKLDGIGRKGISSGEVAGHHALRGRCVANFRAFYGGRVPLVTAPLRDDAKRRPLST